MSANDIKEESILGLDDNYEALQEKHENQTHVSKITTVILPPNDIKVIQPPKYLVRMGILNPLSVTTPLILPKDPSNEDSETCASIVGCDKKVYPKPPLSYALLIAMALKSSGTGYLHIDEIYYFISFRFPYFKTAEIKWKKSLRESFIYRDYFKDIHLNKKYWAINETKKNKVEKLLRDCCNRRCDAIKQSMSDPEALDVILSRKLKMYGYPLVDPLSEDVPEKQTVNLEESLSALIDHNYSRKDFPQ